MQALSFVETLRYYNCVSCVPKPLKSIQMDGILTNCVGNNMKPILIVAPLSTLLNWQKEVNLYTSANCAVFHGTIADRDQFEDFEFIKVKDHKAGKHSSSQFLPKFHYLITSYEMVMEEAYLLRKIPYSVVIVDEGHRLKNKQAQARSALLHLQCDHRVILSGTPIQNNVMELFSLLNFIEPKEFDSESEFLLKFESLVTRSSVKPNANTEINTNETDISMKKSVEDLQLLLKKYLLRREKADVELSIPDKIETIIHVELTMTQKRYYRALLEKNRKYLCRGMSAKKQHFKMGNILMELRKTCNHPYTLEGGKDAIAEDIKLHVNEITNSGITDPIIASSGKFVLLHKLLPKLFKEKSKCLIFSQFVKTLDVLQEYLYKAFGEVYERIDGMSNTADRQAAISRFNSPKLIDPATNLYYDSKSMVFLLSTRTGGVGINLQAANTGKLCYIMILYYPILL